MHNLCKVETTGRTVGPGREPLLPVRGRDLLHRHPHLDILLPAPDQGVHQGTPLQK